MPVCMIDWLGCHLVAHERPERARDGTVSLSLRTSADERQAHPILFGFRSKNPRADDAQAGQIETGTLLNRSPLCQQDEPGFGASLPLGNRRPWTALIYLNEGYEGGATAFVQTDLQVKGGTGDVLIFCNAGLDGRREPLAEHAGLPVTAGMKFLATRWIREQRWIP